MKTIEVTLPTIKDLELQEKMTKVSNITLSVLRTLTQNTKTFTSKAFSQLKSISVVSFKALKRISFRKNRNLGENISPVSSQGEYNENYNQTKKAKLRFPKVSKKSIKRIALLICALIVLGGLGSLVVNKTSTDSRIEIEGAKSAQELNKEFSFPLRTADNEVVSDFKYEILTVEKRDEIVVRGQKATAVKGRTFLVLNIKITNVYTEPIDIDTIDYVRLAVNGNEEEQMAADIHNDSVSVQPISTKYTRIGFPINDTDTDLTLRIGEINGEKESIKLDL
ncbi:hypothetical protein IPM62_04930 [Candidatus Woesebacteria bacterium]|nr:MAG: hypothetical protein IPM62_04930 [Candidatus Woesebacteria bacterium]